jgi:hypothetical protein
MAIPQLQLTAKMLRMTRSRYLHGLSKVPDERLAWSPGGDAKSPLELVQMAALFLQAAAHIAKTRTPPNMAQFPPVPTSREEATSMLEVGFAALSTVLEEVTEADLQSELPAPWEGGGTITLELFLVSTMFVGGYMQGQLNYLQTAYGDKAANIPAGWGSE